MKTNSSAALPGETPAVYPADEAIGFREVYALLGLKCKTGHTALNFARAGKIRAIRINARTIRYSKNSVLALIAGKQAT